MAAAIPVLAYHSLNIAGNEYAGNDHVAFARDLELVTRLGWRVMPLEKIVDGWLAGAPIEKTLGLSFDDGSDFDFHDLPHPTAGSQRSMLNIMRDFQARHPGAQPGLHATSFVIVSPEARHELTGTCMLGLPWWNDDWWSEAAASGLMAIANHSWDHNHATLAQVAQRDQRKGDFFCIDTAADADAQIRAGAHFLASHLDCAPAPLFAYPYGHVNDYLRSEYLPAQARSATPFVKAAFSTAPGAIIATSDRWNLPRYVCGADWKTEAELEAILSAF